MKKKNNKVVQKINTSKKKPCYAKYTNTIDSDPVMLYFLLCICTYEYLYS